MKESMDLLFFIWKRLFDFTEINDIAEKLIQKMSKMRKINK